MRQYELNGTIRTAGGKKAAKALLNSPNLKEIVQVGVSK